MKKTLGFLAVAALTLCLACSEAVDQAQVTSPEIGRGPPTADETCGEIVDPDAIAVGILDLCQNTEAAEYTSRNHADKDRNGQIGKLNRAATKLSQGKTCEAIGKLTEYRNKVLSLRAEDKIIEPVDVDLLVEADAVIAAIAALRGPCDLGG